MEDTTTARVRVISSFHSARIIGWRAREGKLCFVRILPLYVGQVDFFVELPGRGLEPLRISPPDPKSGASANFATLAEIQA